MSSDTKKTGLMENTLNKPRLISEGILMYPDRLDLNEETIGRVVKGGYVVILGNQSFVLTLPEGK